MSENKISRDGITIKNIFTKPEVKNTPAAIKIILIISIVKKVFKKEINNPRIRFDLETNDQKRVLTPKQAYKNGSD